MSAEKKYEKYGFPIFIRENKLTNLPADPASFDENDESKTKTFICNCDECKRYFAKDTPILCVDPYEVEMKKRNVAAALREEAKFKRPVTPPDKKLTFEVINNDRLKRRRR